MSYYKDLQQTDIARAINQMVEIALPRFTRDKVLTISVDMDLDNYKGKKEWREIRFVFYRPDNYTFVGVYKSHENNFRINESSDIEYLSYHDSCWRSDGTERRVAQVAEKMSGRYDDVKGMSVRTSFGVFGTEFVAGNLKIDSTNRKASFVKLEKVNS